MLEIEEINSHDRIALLESKFQKQAEEISYLKNCLAEVIKRIQDIETLKNLPVQSKLSSNFQIVSKSLDHSLKMSSSSNLISNSSSTSMSKSKSTSNPIKTKRDLSSSSQIKDRLNSSYIKSNQSGTLINTSSSFNKSSGTIKFFLKGRPINIYLPNKLLDESTKEFNYNIETKITKPNETLKLEWVYGYRGKDTRSNLHQLPTGEIVYFIAAVVILHNVGENTQRHYLGHTDDVKSISIHPDKITIATGQSTGHKSNGKAHVRIWDSINLTTLKIIGLDSNNEFQNSISCLSFSRCDLDNSYLAIVDDGNDRWLSVWDWKKSEKIVSQKCYGDMVFCVEWHSIDKNMLITCGKQHVNFWIVDFDTRHITKRNALFELNPQTDVIFANPSLKVLGKFDKPKYCLALVCNQKGDIIVGDSEGNILFWNYKEKNNKITRFIKDAHEGGVFTLYASQYDSESFGLISGGKDGRILEWTKEFEKTGRYLEITSGISCRCLLPISQNTSEILIGTTKNTIYKGNLNDNNSVKLIVNSHSDELWGLGNNLRDSNFFMTCGNDRNLNYWDSLSHSLLWTYQFNDERLKCLDIHPQHDVVCIGVSNKSKWIVFDLLERKIVFSQIEKDEGFECIRYSPDGTMLACGSRDNSIYVYLVTENGLKYSRIGKCTGHSSFVTHLDWSKDSLYFMSNSGDYEILYWDAKNCKQITQIQMIRNIDLNTDTCTLSYNTLGIWNGTVNDDINQTYDGTDINACISSRSKQLLASVDDFGQVNLFKYPCNAINCEKIINLGHSSHVTNVTFVNNDLRLISVGGNDMAVFQWAII